MGKKTYYSFPKGDGETTTLVKSTEEQEEYLRMVKSGEIEPTVQASTGNEGIWAQLKDAIKRTAPWSYLVVVLMVTVFGYLLYLIIFDPDDYPDTPAKTEGCNSNADDDETKKGTDEAGTETKKDK